MSIDCVDSVGDSECFEGWEDYNKTAVWNGRDLSLSTQLPSYPDLATKILPFFKDQDRRLQHNVQQFNLEEALLEQEFEFASNALLNQWMLDNSTEQRAEIVVCKTFLKRMLHEVGKGAKKAAKVFRKAMRAIAHATRKSTKKVEKFIKEYKKEILIAAAVVTALCLIYTATAVLAAGAAAVASIPQRKREDGEDEESPSPDLPPLPDWAKEVLKLNDSDFTSTSLETAKKEAHDAWNLFDHLKTVTEADLAHLRKEDPSFNPSTTAIETILDTVFSGGQRHEFSRDPTREHNWQSFIDAGHEKIDQAFSLASAYHAATTPPPSVASISLDQAKLGLSIINQSLQNPQLFDPNSRLDLFFKNQNISIPLEHSQQTVAEFLTNIEQAFKTDPKSIESKIAPSSKVSIPDDFLKIPKSIKVEENQAATESNRSRYFHTEGVKSDTMLITCTFGMNTTFEEALATANYIRSLLPDEYKHLRIDGIYNNTNGPILDISEIITINLAGKSPNVSPLQEKIWTDFHETNIDNPHAKALQISFSQGALHTRNTLMTLPNEIRDRIITLNLGPAAVILKSICFKSNNYASKNDFVPRGERLFYHLLAAFSDEPERLEKLEYLIKIQEELKWLEPHKDSKKFDHEVESKTLVEVIEGDLKDYCEHKGQYP